jgi:hypothetical protein
MDISTACRILGIDTNPSLNDIEVAKRKLLQALHPDKHAPEQKEIFTKMTRDVIEAADFLEKAINLGGGRSGNADETLLEEVLFDESKGYGGTYRGPVSTSKNIVAYEKRYDSDKVLAVAITSIDYGFTWHTSAHPLFGGQSQTHFGCALNLVVMNRTEKAIGGLYIGYQSFLVDDRGHQYSPIDKNFYWVAEAGGQFNSHSDFVAPNSKVEGFVLFPSLRQNSHKFVRWFLRGEFRIDEKYYRGNYDVRLT